MLKVPVGIWFVLHYKKCTLTGAFSHLMLIRPADFLYCASVT